MTMLFRIIRRTVFALTLLFICPSISFLSAFPVSPAAPVQEETGAAPQPDSPEALAYPGDVFWDPRFGAFAPNARVYAIATDSNYVYIGGDFNKIGNVSARGIAKWDGSTWSPVGGGVDGIVRVIEIYNGILYVGGSFVHAGDLVCNDIARWDGTRWRRMGDGVSDPVTIPTIQDIAIFKGEVYVGGGFRRIGGAAAWGIAKWDATGWHAVGTGVRWTTEPGVVFALAADSSYLYLGGRFLKAGDDYIPSLAKWDGNGYMPIEEGAEVMGDVFCLATRAGELIVGGDCRIVSSDYRYFHNLARWDGVQWSDLGGEANAAVQSLFNLGSETYATGIFTKIGDIYARCIAKWSGDHWSRFGSGLQFDGDPSYVFAVAAKPNNEVFVGGDFHIAGGKPSRHLARWYVSPPPNIVAHPGAIADSLLTGQTSSHSLTIKNIGGMVLSWNIVLTAAQSETPPHGTNKHLPFRGGSEAQSSLEDSTTSLEPHNALALGALSWVRTASSAGEFNPGDSAVVQVLFDAAGLPGGEYDTVLTIGSNHPGEPAISIPLHLDVSPAPDIALSDAALAFGVVAIGSSSRDTLHVWNAGSDTLRVYWASADRPEFVLSASAFNMLPGDSVPLEVTFTPIAEGPITGDLVIACNDPDRIVVHVPLSGEGKIPVRINVSPDSLIQTLPIGLEAVQTLTIDNIGPGPFDYLIAVRESAGNATSAAAIERIYELRRWLQESKRKSDDHGAAGALDNSLFGLRILFDRSHGQEELSSRSIFIAWLRQQGASVTANTSPITPNLLRYYNAFWSTETFVSFSSQEIQALTDWIEAGGSILLVGDESNAIANYNTLLSSLNAGIRYAPGGVAAGTTINIYPHVTTHGIRSIYIHHPNAHLSMISDPAVRLVADVNNAPVAAASVVGSGRIVAASEELFNDTAVGHVYNHLFGNQIMSWFLGEVDMQWLSVRPDSGSIAPGQSAEIEILFSAAHVPVGDYDAEVAILSTSWDSAMVVVPARLHVIPASDIALSDASLAFEPLYIGTQISLPLTVYNIGNDTLSVDSLSIDSPSFSTDTTGFLLAPLESIERAVTFHPQARGTVSAALSMTTNDPDESIVSVSLQGEGLKPPAMVVEIDTLYERLLPGEASLRPVAVANLGDAGLVFQIDIFEYRSGVQLPPQEGPAARSAFSLDHCGEPPYDPPRPESTVPSDMLRPEESASALQDIGWIAGTGLPFDSSSVFFENFEDTCSDGWTDGGGSGMKEATGLIGANGTRCSHHEYASPGGHFNGIYRNFGPVQPAYVSFWVRSGDASQNNAYVVFRDASGREAIWFFAASDGAFYINASTGGDRTYPYSADTWYHVEFTNIDFKSKTFDCRVNDSLVKAGISFRNADLVNDMARLDMYNYSSNGEGWWDEILLSLTPHAAWARPDVRSGVVGGEETRTIAVTIDAASLPHGSYDALLHIGTNMAAKPTRVVPLHLDVDSALTRTLTLPLAAGWNVLGWNVDTEDDSFDSLFHSILDNLIVAHGFDRGGLAFSPAIPQEFNTLGSLGHERGVCLKLSAPDTLVIHGKALNGQAPQVLFPGYNLMSYLPYQEDSIGHALASILPSLDYALGYDGDVPSVYWPRYPLSEDPPLATMRPGSAYWLKLSEPATIVYPGLPAYPSTPPFMAEHEQTQAGSSAVIPTTEWVNVWGDSVWIDDHPIQAGTTIRAIDADRIVCGEYVVQSEGRFGIMPVYHDDPYTPKDEGALPGEFVVLFFDSIPDARIFMWHENGEMIRYNDVPVGQPEGPDHPLKLVLGQNYPNPFNPLTTIEYELPEETHVVLAIYTIEGKLVKTLIDGPQPAGILRETWDGRNAAGTALASGIYLYRLQAGAAALTRKMVLIR